MGDDSLRTDTGIFLPPGVESNAMVLEQRIKESIKAEIAQMVGWAQSWERGGQKPLVKIDIQQACMAKAQVYSWPPRFMIAVCAGVCDTLGLNPAPQPDNRQARRARDRRSLSIAPRPVLDPQDPKGNPS
jgi:hypothetical protein